MVDQKQKDQKIVAVLNRDPRYQEVHTLDQIFPHLRREIEHFFNIYKELEGRETSMPKAELVTQAKLNAVTSPRY